MGITSTSAQKYRLWEREKNCKKISVGGTTIVMVDAYPDQLVPRSRYVHELIPISHSDNIYWTWFDQLPGWYRGRYSTPRGKMGGYCHSYAETNREQVTVHEEENPVPAKIPWSFHCAIDARSRVLSVYSKRNYWVIHWQTLFWFSPSKVTLLVFRGDIQGQDLELIIIGLKCLDTPITPQFINKASAA